MSEFLPDSEHIFNVCSKECFPYPFDSEHREMLETDRMWGPQISKTSEIVRLKNWIAQMASTPVGRRRALVEAALQGCSKRFRCGREAKKRVALWGLRMRGAPRPPPVSLPPRGPVDPALLAERRLLKEQPLQNGHVNSSRLVIFCFLILLVSFRPV